MEHGISDWDGAEWRTCEGCGAQGRGSKPTKCPKCCVEICFACHDTHECAVCTHCGEVVEDGTPGSNDEECSHCWVNGPPCTHESHHSETKEEFDAKVINRRPWPEAGLEIGECERCGSTLSFETQAIKAAA